METAAEVRPPTLLKTPRLLLRSLEYSDLERLAEILANPLVMQFSTRGPMTRAASLVFLLRNRHSATRTGTGHLAVVHREDQELIGFCGLKLQQIDGQTDWEIGYRLDPAYWGRGLATEAARGVLHHAHRRLGHTRLIAIIDPRNHSSARVAQKLGMFLSKTSTFHGRDVQIYAWESPDS